MDKQRELASLYLRTFKASIEAQGGRPPGRIQSYIYAVENFTAKPKDVKRYGSKLAALLAVADVNMTLRSDLGFEPIEGEKRDAVYQRIAQEMAPGEV